MNYDPISFKAWLAAALLSKARELPKLIGFLYGHVTTDKEENRGGCIKRTINGVEYKGVVLSKLPEYDRTAYPYVIIFRTNYTSKKYIFNAVKNKPFVVKINGKCAFDVTGNYIECQMPSGEASWSDIEYKTIAGSDGGHQFLGYVYADAYRHAFHTNFDVVYSGERLLTASEPIPIYE